MGGASGVDRGEKRFFSGLDGLRGMAALFVAMRHISFFHNLGVHGGYLAVDLFFVLSGFVIANAYEARLASGLSAKRFLALRYVRLWPVYAAGADATGQAVTPADVGAGRVPVPDQIAVPLAGAPRHQTGRGPINPATGGSQGAYVTLDGRKLDALVNPPPCTGAGH